MANQERHCTHCQSSLEYLGEKLLHEGFAGIALEKIACHLYVCDRCGHLEYFAWLSKPAG